MPSRPVHRAARGDRTRSGAISPGSFPQPVRRPSRTASSGSTRVTRARSTAASSSRPSASSASARSAGSARSGSASAAPRRPRRRRRGAARSPRRGRRRGPAGRRRRRGAGACGRRAGPGRFSGTSANGPSAPRPSWSRLIRSQLERTSSVPVDLDLAEDVRMAADQLRGRVLGDGAEVAGPALLEQQREEVDLEEDVAELVEQLVVVAGGGGVGELVGLLDRVRDDRALVLRPVPRALAPQPAGDRVELGDRLRTGAARAESELIARVRESGVAGAVPRASAAAPVGRGRRGRRGARRGAVGAERDRARGAWRRGVRRRRLRALRQTLLGASRRSRSSRSRARSAAREITAGGVGWPGTGSASGGT